MPFAAGAKVRVSALNELGGAAAGATPTGGYARMTSDVTVTNSTTLVEATGLTFDLAASATYAFHGWLLYTALAAGDLKVRPVAPSGASGYWSLLGSAFDQTGVASTEWKNYGQFQGVDLGTSLNAAGTTDGTTYMAALIDGFVTTTDAGEHQLQVAQRAANATATVLRAGSWLRLVRLA